jgi:hypothetical protein
MAGRILNALASCWRRIHAKPCGIGVRPLGDRHGVRANASETKPAKLLALFVVDTNERRD